MSSYQTIEAGSTERFFTVVAKASGDPIDSGTVNYYLLARSGSNVGKWWRDSDQTWQASETPNAMTHVVDGHWEIDLASSPFADGIRYLEYLKESGNLHVPDKRHLVGADDHDGVSDANQAAIIALLTEHSAATTAAAAASAAADTSTAVSTAATSPKSVTTDGVTVQGRDVREVIEADLYAKSNTAVAGNRRGLVMQKLSPPGAS